MSESVHTGQDRRLIIIPGPVRGVAIHPSRALLATGGDDYKIKVWGESDFQLSALSKFLMYHRSSTSKQALSIHLTWSSRLRPYGRFPP